MSFGPAGHVCAAAPVRRREGDGSDPSDAYDPGPTASLSFPLPKAILMTRTATSWSGKTLMWLLVCLVSMATSDDFWSFAMASSSSQLLIVADDDDPDDRAERMPACASGDVGYTDLLWFVRNASEINGRDELRSGFVLPYGPRGPPARGSDQQCRTNSLCFWPAAVDSSIVAPLLAAATLQHTTLEVQTPADCSCNRTTAIGYARVDLRVSGGSAVGLGGRPQLIDATDRPNTSDGFIQPNVCRGRLLSSRATLLSSARV
jgi:hypothetical protein